jgi:hypothetical protein
MWPPVAVLQHTCLRTTLATRSLGKGGAVQQSTADSVSQVCRRCQIEVSIIDKGVDPTGWENRERRQLRPLRQTLGAPGQAVRCPAPPYRSIAFADIPNNTTHTHVRCRTSCPSLRSRKRRARSSDRPGAEPASLITSRTNDAAALFEDHKGFTHLRCLNCHPVMRSQYQGGSI